jgi:hypothetical protein
MVPDQKRKTNREGFIDENTTVCQRAFFPGIPIPETEDEIEER